MLAYQLPEEVIKTTYEHDKFLTEVIGDGSNTKGKNIAIIGEPGAGKSTLLEKIGEYLIKHDGLPIYIPLSNLSGDTLKEYLLNRWLENPVTSNQLQELLQQQRVWFLLDGLDEMQAASSVDALNKISQDISKLAAARVVLTCRLNVWDASTKNLLDFQNFKTQEFSSEQVRVFILKWFQRAEEEESEVCHSERNVSEAKNLTDVSLRIQQGEQLWQKLNESGRERLLDLVKNPLRLALMCQVWDTTKDLPETQAALYKRFTLYHYEWKQAEFPTTLAQQYELNAALGKLAREAIASGKTRFRIGQKFAYDKMGENLFNCACRLGWLNQVDREKQTDEPFYAFYHATFQEYFAALAIDDWHFLLNHIPNNPSQGTYRIFEPQWKQVILLWLGCEEVKTEQKEQFIKALIEFEDNCNNFYKYRAYILAATGIAEFGDCSKADEIVEQIVKWDFDPSLINILFQLIKEATIKWLLMSIILGGLFITPDSPLQKAAKAVLAETYRPKAINSLVKLTRNSKDDFTRREAAESLGKIGAGNSDAIRALVDLTRNSKDDYTRREAAESLGEIDPGNSDAISALVDLIGNSKDDFTRWRAAESLGKIGAGNSDAIRALVDLIRNSKDDSTRSHAAWSLGKIGAGNSDAISALVDLIGNSKDDFTRWRAAESLGEIDPGNSDAISALVDLIGNSKDDFTRWRAAESLGKIGAGNSDAIRALVDLIRNSKNDSTRREAAESLGEIDPGNSDAIRALVDLIRNSKNDSTRREAAESLGEIDPGNSDAIRALVDLTRNSKDDDTRREAAYSLGKIGAGNSDAISALVDLTRNS
ncbi:NACHT domain-containing protein [Mastigocladopsis repens]|uniref:NACHT domain-containing protein n=1 Tax=Mastigocladopsis repens TaxID=221287 RepID=UPI0002EF5ADA|nr:HEAT repeat domain-containing protein [Mastigocladopsis repens]